MKGKESSMGWFLGFDIGSAYSKGVLIQDAKICHYLILPSGFDYRRTAEEICSALLDRAGLSAGEIGGSAATGIGSGNVSFAGSRISDILCTGRGIGHIFPGARTIIDVGGMSTRVMNIQEGRVTNFTASEKCAAGSARFIEVIAAILKINLRDFGPVSLKGGDGIRFNTGCAVFGESEAITRVTEGVPKEDIAAGVNRALAEKISSLVKKIGMKEPCVVCGGGALNNGLIRRLETELKLSLRVPDQPQIVAAAGAAISAKAREKGLG